MVTARAASFSPEVGFALSREASSTVPGSSAFAEATADESPAATASGKIPSAVSSTHAVQSPLGASEKIFAPHLRQTLITLIIARDSACVLILYCVEFCRVLCANHSNQISNSLLRETDLIWKLFLSERGRRRF